MLVARRSDNEFSCKGYKNLLNSVGNCLTYGFLIVISKCGTTLSWSHQFSVAPRPVLLQQHVSGAICGEIEQLSQFTSLGGVLANLFMLKGERLT